MSPSVVMISKSSLVAGDIMVNVDTTDVSGHGDINMPEKVVVIVLKSNVDAKLSNCMNGADINDNSVDPMSSVDTIFEGVGEELQLILKLDLMFGDRLIGEVETVQTQGIIDISLRAGKIAIIIGAAIVVHLDGGPNGHITQMLVIGGVTDSVKYKVLDGSPAHDLKNAKDSQTGDHAKANGMTSEHHGSIESNVSLAMKSLDKAEVLKVLIAVPLKIDIECESSESTSTVLQGDHIALDAHNMNKHGETGSVVLNKLPSNFIAKGSKGDVEIGVVHQVESDCTEVEGAHSDDGLSCNPSDMKHLDNVDMLSLHSLNDQLACAGEKAMPIKFAASDHCNSVRCPQLIECSIGDNVDVQLAMPISICIDMFDSVVAGGDTRSVMPNASNHPLIIVDKIGRLMSNVHIDCDGNLAIVKNRDACGVRDKVNTECQWVKTAKVTNNSGVDAALSEETENLVKVVSLALVLPKGECCDHVSLMSADVSNEQVGEGIRVHAFSLQIAFDSDAEDATCIVPTHKFVKAVIAGEI